MGNNNTTLVDDNLRSVMGSTLKTISSFKALMAEAIKRSTDHNCNDGHKDGKEGDKNIRMTLGSD